MVWNPFKKSKKEELFGRHEYINWEEENVKSEAVNHESRITHQESTEEGWEERKRLEPLPMEVTDGQGWPEERPDQSLPETAEAEWEAKPMPQLRRWVRGLLFALVGLMPVWFLPFTAPGDILVASKQLLIFGLVIGALAIWATMIVKQGGVVFRQSGWEWGILAVWGAWLLAAVFSPRPYLSFTGGSGLITLSSLVLFFFLAVNFWEKKDLGRVINYWVLGSGLAIVIGLLMTLGAPVGKVLSWLFPANIAVGSQFNTIGSFNGLGALAVIGLVLAVSRVTRGLSADDARSAWWAKIYWAAGLAFAWWVLILNWWVFYLALILGVVGVSLGSVVRRQILTAEETIRARAASLLLPILILVLSLSFIFSDRFLNFNVSRVVLGGRTLPVEVALSQRTSWQISKEVLNLRPVFGVGAENFVSAFDQFKPGSLNQTIFWSTRFTNSASEMFDWLAEGGVVTLTALGYFLFFIGRDLVKGVLGRRENNEESWEAAPAWLVVLALFFLFPFNLTLVFAFWLLVTLMAVGRNREDVGWRRVRIDNTSVLSVLVSLVMALALVGELVGGFLLVQKYSGNVVFAEAARMNIASVEDLDKATNFLAKAVNINDKDDVSLSNLATVLLQKVSLEINNREDDPAQVQARLQSLTSQVVQIANRLAERSRHNAINWYNAGFIYENLTVILSGADNAAISAYREYVKLAPSDPNVHVRIGRIYLARGDRNNVALSQALQQKQKVTNEKEVDAQILSDYQAAEASFKKAVELKSDLATALYNLGIVYERLNQVKEAVGQLEKVRAIDSGNPGLAFELGLLYYRNGQKDEALAEMARAVALFNGYANARWYLALMLEERGRLDLAIGQLKAILAQEVNKDNQVLLEKLVALEAGQREIPPATVTSKEPLTAPAYPQR